MDPQLSKIRLKTLRNKTEIFKLVMKHISLAEQKTRQNSLEGTFYRCKITSLDTSRLEARKLADIIFPYKSTLNYFNYKTGFTAKGNIACVVDRRRRF